MTTYKEVFQLAQEKGFELQFTNVDTFEQYFAAPEEWELLELTLIQKWLRDEKKIAVIVDLPSNGYYWILHDLSLEQDRMISYQKGYSASYEQALLEGINEALKLLLEPGVIAKPFREGWWLIDTRTNERWANEYFKTLEEIQEFCKVNNLKLLP